MRVITIILTSLLIPLMTWAQDKIEIKANGRNMTATLADSEAAEEFLSRLENGDVTVSMNDYGGFEKVGDLPWSLPASDTQITTSAGDIMLYQGHSIVIFYESNSWAYTPLGKIDGVNASQIKEILAGNPVIVSFSKQIETEVSEIAPEPSDDPEIFTIQGRKINPDGRKISDLPKGTYIINGKKKFIR